LLPIASPAWVIPLRINTMAVHYQYCDSYLNS
jgi:hypothetical protein